MAALSTLRGEAVGAGESNGQVSLLGVSRFFRSEAYPSGSGPDFVNAAAVLATELSPEDLLAQLHRIEARFARERPIRWGARTLDLDLLTWNETVIPDAATNCRWVNLNSSQQQIESPEQLILPHPRLQDRAFVLAPLAEILPGWRHPILGRTVAEMLMALPKDERLKLRPFALQSGL